MEKMLADIFNAALLVATPFVPVLGELMLAYTAYQMLDDVFEGIVDWAEGLQREGWEHWVSVADNVLQLALFHAGGSIGLSPRYIKEAVEASLKRLQTDYIDLYQSHDDDADTPLAESLAAFDALIKEGKVRAIGASNYSAPRLAEALKVSKDNGLARYETLQPLYNLYDRKVYEEALEKVVTENGVGVINFYGLASGWTLLKVKVLLLRSVKTCTVWPKLTKLSRTTASNFSVTNFARALWLVLLRLTATVTLVSLLTWMLVKPPLPSASFFTPA